MRRLAEQIEVFAAALFSISGAPWRSDRLVELWSLRL